jgi:hypothetical protein
VDFLIFVNEHKIRVLSEQTKGKSTFDDYGDKVATRYLFAEDDKRRQKNWCERLPTM